MGMFIDYAGKSQPGYRQRQGLIKGCRLFLYESGFTFEPLSLFVVAVV